MPEIPEIARYHRTRDQVTYTSTVQGIYATVRHIVDIHGPFAGSNPLEPDNKNSVKYMCLSCKEVWPCRTFEIIEAAVKPKE